MKDISGFVAKSSFINNVPDSVSEFFELSPFALTYSRERGEYQLPGYVGDTLHTFRTIDTSSGDSYVLPESQVDEILGVVEAVRLYMTNNSYPYDLNDLRQTILVNFDGQIESLTLGSFYVGAIHTLPEWMSWKSLTHPDTNIKIWLRNEAFENQYTHYKIVVVPPLDNLDSFFGTYGNRATELNAISISDTIDRIQTFKDEKPESYTRVLSFDFVNTNNPDQKTAVRWGVLIYGKNGDNIDAIKDAIVDYVLMNSSHVQSEWEAIFPDLFKRTEFRFYPRWDLVSIPNLTELSAIYSSIADPLETVTFAKAVWPEVPADFIEANLSVWPFDYKSIQLVALNGESNVIGKEKLKPLYPDYIPVSTSSPDFNRMSPGTREWVLKMVELIHLAETATEFTSIESPFRRVIRENVLYVTLVHDEINYLIAARSNLN